MENIKVYVKGMTCAQCKTNVEKSIKTMNEVQMVSVDLERSIAEIRGEDMDMNDIKKRIEGAGYEYGGLIP